MKTHIYERHPDAIKTGGLNISEKNSSTGSVITDVLKMIFKKMLEGNLKDILKISSPAKIASPVTYLNCTANDYRYSELINKAAEQTDPVERMKYVTAFLLAGIHYNPVLCKSKAPLNPILGETFQSKKDDGTEIYLEQTSHHPPTSNFHVIGPHKNYELFGFATLNATLYGINSIKGFREGKNIIKFKDGSLLKFTLPGTMINSLIFGERNFHYTGNLIIKDFTNKIESATTFSYKESGKIESLKNSITSLFSSKTNEVCSDYIDIQIFKVNTVNQTKELLSEGHGSWIGQVYIDGKKFWSYDDDFDPWKQTGIHVLSSDSLYRSDLKSIIQTDFDAAQKSKDEYENLQRHDKKLREANKNK